TNLDTVPREVWSRVKAAIVAKSMSHREFAAAMSSQFCGSTMWKHAPSRSRLATAAGILGDSTLELLASTDVFWDEIVEVTGLGEQPVYDATVSATHNFIVRSEEHTSELQSREN